MKALEFIIYIFIIATLNSCYVNSEKLLGHYRIPYNGFIDAQLYISIDTFLYEKLNLCAGGSIPDTGIGKYNLDKNKLTLFYEPQGIEINEIPSSNLQSDSILCTVMVSDNQLLEGNIIDHIKIRFSGNIKYKNLTEEHKITRVGQECKIQYPSTISRPNIVISLGMKHKEKIYYPKHGIIYLNEKESMEVNLFDVSKIGSHVYQYGVTKYKVRNTMKEIRLIETYHPRGWSSNMRLVKSKKWDRLAKRK